MSVRPIPITLRPNQGHFLSDLANLFRRHKVRCGDPSDLEHLPSEFESNPQLCKDLFLLCTAISHMSEADLSPDELAELIIRAVGGPRTMDSPVSNAVAAATRSAFVERYTAWLSGTTEQPVAGTSIDEDTWQVPETPFVRAARLSRKGGAGASTAESVSRKVSPETAIGDLTLRELSEYLVELEQRVKRAEAYLGPVQAAGHSSSVSRHEPEDRPAARPDPAEEPRQIELVPPGVTNTSIEDEGKIIAADGPEAIEEEVQACEEMVQAHVDTVPAHVDTVPVEAEEVPAYDQESPAHIEETKFELLAEETGSPFVAHPAIADPVSFSRLGARSAAPASLAFTSESPSAPGVYTGARDRPGAPRRSKISLPTAAVFAFAVLGGAAVGYRFMVQTPDHSSRTVAPETRNKGTEPQVRYDEQGSASGSATHAELPLDAAPYAAVRPNVGAPGSNPGVKPQAAPPPAAAPNQHSSTATAPPPGPPFTSSGPLPAVATLSVPVLPDVVPAPITRVLPPESTPNATTRQVIEPYTQRTNSDVTPEAASRPAVETAAGKPGADVPRPSAATPAATATNHASPALVSVPSSTLMRSALSIPGPRYPVGRHVNVDTSVVVRATISRDGRVTSAKAVSGSEDLRNAAQNAMLQWRFRPYLVDGAPVEVVTAVTFMFKAH